MFFKKKPKIRFIEYKPEEFEPRAEWLFWSLFIHLQSEVENLKNIFEIDDYKWSLLKNDALFEILLWSMGNSMAILQDKLSDEEGKKLTRRFVIFSEIFFPSYKDYQIIDVLSNYIAFAQQTKDHKKLRSDLEDFFIERVAKLFKLHTKQTNQEKIRDSIFMKFPHGWLLALDAFSSVTMGQIERENQMARQRFRDTLIQAKERSEKGETEGEKKDRKKWEKSVDEFNKIVGETKEIMQDEINRRQKVEKSLKKFILQINSETPLDEQLIEWVKKEELNLSDNDIEKFVDKAYSKYTKLQSSKNRKNFEK